MIMQIMLRSATYAHDFISQLQPLAKALIGVQRY